MDFFLILPYSLKEWKRDRKISRSGIPGMPVLSKKGGHVSFVLSGAMQDLIYLRPAEQDDHTEVYPQHHHEKQRQTAVQIGCPGKIADI